MSDEPKPIDLSFSREGALTPEKLSSFEQALEHSYSLYKNGLQLHSGMIGEAPNKHIKMSIANADGTSSAILNMLERCGDIIVLNNDHARAMMMPFTLAASELLNTEPM